MIFDTIILHATASNDEQPLKDQLQFKNLIYDLDVSLEDKRLSNYFTTDKNSYQIEQNHKRCKI